MIYIKQLFATSKGAHTVYLFRIQDTAATNDGELFAYVTENGRTVSKDAESTATKDGTVRTPKPAEVSITSNSILKENDDRLEAYEDAMLSDKLIECWEADLDRPVAYTYELTEDTAIDPSKTYYTRSGTSPNYTYTAVTNPSAASLSSYYERTAAKFKGRYYQGYITSFEKTSNADGYVEVDIEFAANGSGAKGNVTVSAAQQEEATYAFADTPKTGA